MKCDRCGNWMQSMFCGMEPDTFTVSYEYLCTECWAVLTKRYVNGDEIDIWYAWGDQVGE